jgi:7-cyano-7-deazaguanine tRNA-ribosyltransferase
VPRQEYEAFVRDARPDWYAIPQEYIPTPAMSDAEQLECLRRTMEVNRAYRHNGFVPVVHASRHLDAYLDQLLQDEQLSRKPHVGLGGLVPNLLRTPQAAPYAQVLRNVRRTRTTLSRHRLHVFGIGGTATLHLAVLLGIDSVDSSGWRNRAARGIVQLSGRGDRMVAELGSWRGRRPDDGELLLLAACPCPACRWSGLPGLQSSGVHGFANRATHNLWTLLEEARSVSAHLADQTYAEWFEGHLHNSIYVPLVRRTLLDLQHAESSVHPR